MKVRPLTVADAGDARVLYDELTAGPPIVAGDRFHEAFARILGFPGTSVMGAEQDGQVRAMATLHLLPNITWDARPYGLIENVVSHRNHRREGLARAVMEAIIDAAWAADAYKIMLMTGRARGATGFYEALGFSDRDKHAMTIRSA